jgi:hypothetical protein
MAILIKFEDRPHLHGDRRFDGLNSKIWNPASEIDRFVRPFPSRADRTARHIFASSRERKLMPFEQERWHRSLGYGAWPRHQPALLPNDGRRHYGREQARSRIDLHDPAAKDCGSSQGSGGCQSGPHRRGGAETSIRDFAALRESGCGTKRRRPRRRAYVSFRKSSGSAWKDGLGCLRGL